jgi:hypothetical protein
MNRTAVTLAGLSLLGFLQWRGSLSQPGNSSNSTTEPQVSPPNSLIQEAGRTSSNKPTSKEEGPWTPVCGYFHFTGEPADHAGAAAKGLTPAACVPDDYHGGVQMLVSIVPDPVNSYLALEYDRSMESIERAAADQDYTFDRYWLPWRDTDIRSRPGTIEIQRDSVLQERLRAQERKQRQQQPGLIVFHRKQGMLEDSTKPMILLVFVVGETPASGLNKDELSNALFYIRGLHQKLHSCDQFALDIAGPHFSASLQPLGEVFKSLLVKDPRLRRCGPSAVRVISGSASNDDAIYAARQAFQEVESATLGRVQLRLNTLALHERFKFDVIVAELRRITGANCDELAYLSETASDYPGFTYSGGCPEINISYFPRNIAPLRNAYQAAQDVMAQAKGAAQLPQVGLPLTYREPEVSNQDQFPIMAPDHTALSQDAVMRRIVQRWQQRKIRAVIIGASSSLDTLFLMDYLRKSAPNVRMAVSGSDSLYFRPSDPSGFTGTIIFSQHPLLIGHLFDPTKSFLQPWIDWPEHSTTAMEHRLAVRAALCGGNPSSSLQCANEFRSRPDPIFWIGVMGKDGFWPLSTTYPDGTTQPGKNFVIPRPSLLWYWLLLLMDAAAALHYFLIFGTQFNLFRWGKVWWTEYYALDHGDGDYLQARGCFLLLATVNIAIMQLVFLVPTWRLLLQPPEPLASPETSKIAWLFIAVSLAVLALGAVAMVLAAKAAFGRYKSKPPSKRPEPAINIDAHQELWWNEREKVRARAERSIRGLALLFLAGFAGVAWAWVHLCREPNGAFFSYRATALLSGVSPALPMLLTGAGIYLCAMSSMRRITYFQNRFATFPKNFDPILQTDAGELAEDLNSTLTPIAFFVIFKNLRWLVALVLVGCILYGFHWYGFHLVPRSVESMTYNLLVFAGIGGIWILVLLATIRFLDVWRASKNLLRRLERLPIRYPFSRIPTLFSWSPVWRLGGIKRSLLVQTRSLEYLHRLSAHSLPEPVPQGSSAIILPELSHIGDVREELQKVLLREARNSRIDSKLWRSLDEALRKQAEDLIAGLLTRAWGMGEVDSVSDEWGVRRKDLPQGLASTQEVDRKILLAAEFVALRFVAVIRYVSLQMRNLLATISFGFVLALLAVKSYPFQPHQQINLWIVIVFVVLGCTLITVFTDMGRNPVLRRLSAPHTGKFSVGLLWPLAKFGALPLLTVLASQFPAFSNFLFSWLGPFLEKAH